MSIDQVDFSNTMRTIGWNTQAVQGFEQEAYGAALSLIHYIDHLTPAGRLAWAQANNAASRKGQSGIQKTKDGTYLSWLNQLRLQVYGLGVDDESVTEQPMRVQAPWSLSDAEFSYCMLYIKTGRAPDESKFEKQYLNATEQMVAGKVEDSLRSQALQYLELGAAAVGGTALRAYFTVQRSWVGGVVLTIAWAALSAELAKRELATLTARYTLDEQRRLYLGAKGLSNYKQIVGL